MIGSILDVQSAANGTSMDVWLVGGPEGAVKSTFHGVLQSMFMRRSIG